MGHIISRLYMFGEFIIPPRLHLRIEHSRVKNMLPSYTQVPEDCTDSERESALDVFTSQEAGAIEAMRGTTCTEKIEYTSKNTAQKALRKN